MDNIRTDLFSNWIIQHRGLIFGIMIITALLAFEVFNYSTTEYALSDLLGGLEFLGMRWATILAIAFCGIDFAGIARLFTPEQGAEEPTEVWYLFGAWLLAATMNAMLTWWGVSLAVLNDNTLGNAIVERGTLVRVVPLFVAIMVWLIRVLIIGTFSMAGDRLFSQSDKRFVRSALQRRQPLENPGLFPGFTTDYTPVPQGSTFRPAPKPGASGRFEPTYRPVHGAAQTGEEIPRPGASRQF
jgi:hypothetical protein